MTQRGSEDFVEISPSDFFYRNKDIAGFDNPTRSMYTAVREVVENALDACEQGNVLPDILIRVSATEEGNYVIRIQDNGIGIPVKRIPPAFGKVFYGSKYKLRQSRGTFGVGGTMALLYGQITTNKAFRVISSTGGKRLYGLTLRIDIKTNQPIIEHKQVALNRNSWHGTIVEFTVAGNWKNARNRIIEYLRQTAVITPYANITLRDEASQNPNPEQPDGVYNYRRISEELPKSPKEILPHPQGIDVEMVTRVIANSKQKNLTSFLMKNFHRVGPKIAKNFLNYSNMHGDVSPKDLQRQEIVKLVRALKNYPDFIPPNANCLSPIGQNNLSKGVTEILKPERVYADQRPPSAYSGHPFIVETAIAYGGNIPRVGSFLLYRFANRIPLLFDGGSDLSTKVINDFNWKQYKITQDVPVALITHICSTKIPFKTVGKEFIADIPEIRKQLSLSFKENARKMRTFINKYKAEVHRQKRSALIEKYLPKIAELSTTLAGESTPPSLKPFIRIRDIE
ncbi:MAG: DNA topoisomerase VI subunit B [Candidatus Ranarchaeia archaeon]|jgi:DNA topoisomerase-6 subunit B